MTKIVTSVSLDEDVYKHLAKSADVLDRSMSSIMESALRLLFKNPQFSHGVAEIEKILKETEVLKKVEDDGGRGKRNQK